MCIVGRQCLSNRVSIGRSASRALPLQIRATCGAATEHVRVFSCSSTDTRTLFPVIFQKQPLYHDTPTNFVLCLSGRVFPCSNWASVLLFVSAGRLSGIGTVRAESGTRPGSGRASTSSRGPSPSSPRRPGPQLHPPPPRTRVRYRTSVHRTKI